jgi:16S rRNA (cytidine1402-2'-O)-methyltransferase
MSTGILYLFPGPLAETDVEFVLPKHNIDLIKLIKHFVAEDAKIARRFLKLCAYPNIQDAEISLLNEHTESGSYASLLEPLLKGEHIGLMSDAGCPGIADPGAELIRLAHKKGIKVVPLVGPSSVVLTIMASGFNGQNFAFNGYLPIEKDKRVKRIKELESLAFKYKQAQYFIETPYRNVQLLADLLTTLDPSVQLCMAKNLTDPSQQVISRSVAEWKKMEAPEIHKVPVVFGIYF